MTFRFDSAGAPLPKRGLVLGLLLLFFLVSCVTGGAATPETDPNAPLPGSDMDLPPAALTAQPQVVQQQLPASIDSLTAWDGLDKELRFDILQGEYSRYSNLSLTPRQPIAQVKVPTQRALAEKMVKFMRANGEMKVDDAGHSTVGPVETYAQILLLDGKTPIGGLVDFEQRACDMTDETATSFKSKAAADAAGCETSSGAWGAHGSFNHDGAPLDYGDYMEWSGPDSAGL